MTERTCLTCKHFEPSATWKRGWCRNPRLYGPQQSHAVDEDSLDCNRGIGDFWEPIDTDPAASGGFAVNPQANAERTDNSGVQGFGSIGRVGAADADFGAADEPGDAGLHRGDGQGLDVPRAAQEELPVSQSSNERYWTDYLRIALPVLGLLLLIGLLWYWASALIGGPSATQPVATVVAQVTVVSEVPVDAQPSPTAMVIGQPTVAGQPPADGQQVVGQPTAISVQPTAPAVVAATATAVPAAPTEVPAQDVADNPCASLPIYDVGTNVMTNETEVNLRNGPSSDSDIVVTMPIGTVLQTTDVVRETGQCDWYPVMILETGETGFVIEQFIELGPQ